MSNQRKPPNRPRNSGFGPPDMGIVDKPKDFKRAFRKLLQYLGNYKFSILIVMIFAIIATVFSIVGPKMLGNATTELFSGIMGTISGTSDGVDFGIIGGILLNLAILYFISAFFSLIQGYIMTGVSNNLTYKLRREVSEKIHKLPFSYYDKTTKGEVLSKITNDIDVISQNFNQGITQIISSMTMIIGVLIMMFGISPVMSVIALTTLPISAVIIGIIVKKSQKYFVKQQEYIGNVNSHVEEMYSCHNIVKAFNGEERSLREFKEYNDKLYESAWKSNFLSGLMMPIMIFIGNLGYVAVCIVGGYYAANGAIKVGDIQAFIQYMQSFMQPISQLSQISNVLQHTMAASERVFEFLGEEEEIPEIENALSVLKDTDNDSNAVKVFGNVTFSNVNFGYIKGKTIVNDFSAEIKRGKKIAIVGPTGAGKTTIVKLLMRFYDIDSGIILLDDNDIKNFKRDELRSVFGMVLQDTWLYSGTIADNIRYGKLNATLDEIKKAAKAAQVHHFVTTLPDGYNMQLNEDAGNVSQGQKQLITIARAILADPKILILDEATSSVDTRTEILIQKAMDNLMENRTSFIIAHRLSTIRNADLILVMDKGDIVEQGNHDDLLAQNGFYANLYNSQFENLAG